MMIEFRIENLRCGGCVAGITRAVRQVDALARVDIDRATRTVRIAPHAASEAALAAAIGQAGYRIATGAVPSDRQAG